MQRTILLLMLSEIACYCTRLVSCASFMLATVMKFSSSTYDLHVTLMAIS